VGSLNRLAEMSSLIWVLQAVVEKKSLAARPFPARLAEKKA